MATVSGYYSNLTIADKAAADITQFLESTGWHVRNVEHDPYYQERDIDLVAIKATDPKKFPTVLNIEIKGDKYYSTGNYFIETISNMNKNTPGCFLYTKSDYIFYYFTEQRELHIIPTKEAQEWFLSVQDTFTKFGYPQTCDRAGKVLYKSKGTLVKRKTMQKYVDIDIKNI